MMPAACSRGPRWPAWRAGCRGNGSGGRRSWRLPPRSKASRCQPAGRPGARPAGRDGGRHPDRGRVRVVQPDQVQRSRVSAAFLQLGDHAHRERHRRADLPGPVIGALPVPAPGQDQPASHHRPHLRADFRLPRGSGTRGHPHEHVAAVGMQLVPVQVLGGEPACGLALQRRDQQPVPLRGRGQPGQGQDIEVVTVEGQGIRDARHPVARADRPASGREELAVTITHLQGRGWGRRPPPARGTVDQRSTPQVMSSPAARRTPARAARPATPARPRGWGHPARTPPAITWPPVGPHMRTQGRTRGARPRPACLLPGVPSRGLDHSGAGACIGHTARTAGGADTHHPACASRPEKGGRRGRRAR